MKILTTRKNIRSRQPHKRQPRTIRATTDRQHPALHTTTLHSLTSIIHHKHHRLNTLTHIIILITNHNLNRPRTKLLIQLIPQMNQLTLPILKTIPPEIPHNILQHRTLHTTLHHRQMKKTIITLRMLRSLKPRQHLHKLTRNTHRITQLMIRITRMNIPTTNRNHRLRRIKRLILKLTHSTTIHRIREIRPKTLHVKMIRALTNLLIRSKTNPHTTMLHTTRHQTLQTIKNSRHARLIIRAKQRPTVRHNNIITHIPPQLRKIHRRQHHTLLTIQHNITTIITTHNTRTHTTSRKIRTRINMSNKTHRRNIPTTITLQRPSHITKTANLHITQPNTPQIIRQTTSKRHLRQRRRHNTTRPVTLSINPRVRQKPLKNIHNKNNKNNNHFTSSARKPKPILFAVLILDVII